MSSISTVAKWFASRGLPWDDDIEKSLVETGVE